MAQKQKMLFGTIVFVQVWALTSAPTVAGPETEGAWEGVIAFDFLTQVAVHSVVLKTGKVLMISHGNLAWVFDPTDNTHADLLNPPLGSLLFCSGHCQLADGRVLFVGGGNDYGEDSNNKTVVFDPDKAGPPYNDPTMWSLLADTIPANKVPPADGRRWYPTCSPLGDGKVLVLGGGKDDGD